LLRNAIDKLSGISGIKAIINDMPELKMFEKYNGDTLDLHAPMLAGIDARVTQVLAHASQYLAILTDIGFSIPDEGTIAIKLPDSPEWGLLAEVVDAINELSRTVDELTGSPIRFGGVDKGSAFLELLTNESNVKTLGCFIVALIAYRQHLQNRALLREHVRALFGAEELVNKLAASVAADIGAAAKEAKRELFKDTKQRDPARINEPEGFIDRHLVRFNGLIDKGMEIHKAIDGSSSLDRYLANPVSANSILGSSIRALLPEATPKDKE
jgi:hypothetical protein